MSRIAPAVLLAALLGGCWGGSISKGEFIARANAVCATSGARIARLSMSPSGPRVAAEGGYVDAYVAEMQEQIARLRRLGYPAGDRRLLQAIYASFQTVLAHEQQMPATFHSRQIAAVNEQLRLYGLTACRT